MRARTDVFSGGSETILRNQVRARRGRPGRPIPPLGRNVQNRHQGIGNRPLTVRGSHMPIDTGLSWRWNNPLNVIPLLIVVSVVLALVALMA